MLVSTLPGEFTTPKAKQNWLSYWKYFSKSEQTKCAVCGCADHTVQGTFVHPADTQDSVFVVPVCEEHRNAGQITISEGVKLIPIDLTL